MALPPEREPTIRERICAVIPTYNCKEPLAQCLEAVRRQTRPVDEIIVVDNASTDGTGEMIQGRFAGTVTNVRLAENLGGAGGFDKGMRLAYEHGHDWIWCIDSDALPSETALNEMLAAHFPSDRPVVAKTCAFRDPVSGELYPGGGLDRFKRRGDVSFPQAVWEGRILPVDICTLCCLLVRADAAQRAGFIRADFFIYVDEIFFSYKLKAQGEIVQIGAVLVSHRKGIGRYTIRWGRRRLIAENYWRTYYLFRNTFVFEKESQPLWRALGRFTYSYLRVLGSTLLLDDRKFYRVGIVTKAFCDGLLGRMGKRVEPPDFEKRRSLGAAVARVGK